MLTEVAQGGGKALGPAQTSLSGKRHSEIDPGLQRVNLVVPGIAVEIVPGMYSYSVGSVHGKSRFRHILKEVHRSDQIQPRKDEPALFQIQTMYTDTTTIVIVPKFNRRVAHLNSLQRPCDFCPALSTKNERGQKQKRPQTQQRNQDD